MEKMLKIIKMRFLNFTQIDNLGKNLVINIFNFKPEISSQADILIQFITPQQITLLA